MGGGKWVLSRLGGGKWVLSGLCGGNHITGLLDITL